MSFPVYAKYRESNLPWVGQLPAHWKVHRLKTLFTRAVRPSREDDDIVTAFRDGQVTRRKDRRNDGFTISMQEIGYQGVRSGDLVIHAMDAFAGAIGVSDADGKSTPVYSVCIPNVGADAHYYALLLRHMALSGFITALARGVRERSTEFRWADASVLSLPYPSIEEQCAIVAFLDREMKKIDALIEAQLQLIKLLQEKRRVLIARAVTTGLDPCAVMKDSGIRWLGKVPAHWEIFALKRELEFLTSGSRGWAEHYSDDGALFIRIGNLTRDHLDLDLTDIQKVTVPTGLEAARTRVQTDDILFSITAYLGSVAVVPSGLEAAYVSQHVALARLTRKRLLPRWAALVASSLIGRTYLDMQGYGGTKVQLALNDVANMPMVVPPLLEQAAVLAEVERQTSSFDHLIVEAKAAVDLLRERRTALISAAVTGKIDVRAFPKLDRSQLLLIVGAHIVSALSNRASSGRTKAHKLVYLAQAHGGVHELEGAYMRQAAGPLDAQLIDEMEGAFKRTGCISVEQPGGRGSQVFYSIRSEGCGFQGEFHATLGTRAKAVDKLIADLADFDVHAVEAIATLYAVWNDFLLDGQAPTDDEIIRDFLENWHPKKAENFRRPELHTWLGWMRRHGLVPQGRGPRTTTGRLFA